MPVRIGKYRIGSPLLAACALICHGAIAQSATDSVTPATQFSASQSGREERVDLATLEQQRRDIEANSNLSDIAKNALLAKYDNAISLAKRAADYRARRQRFADAVKTAPAETKRLQLELNAVSSDTHPGSGLNADELTAEIENRRASLLELRAKLKDANQQSARLKDRPVEIGSRLPDARAELVKARAELAEARAGQSNPANISSLLPLAKVDALEAEVDMLDQERISLNARDELTSARISLLETQIARAETELATLQQHLERQVRQEAEALSKKVDTLTSDPESETDGADFSHIETELKSLSRELKESAAKLNEVNTRHEEIQAKNKEIEYQRQRLTEQLALGAYAGSFSQIIFEQRRNLPDPETFSHSIASRARDLQKFRLLAFHNEGRLREQQLLETPADSPPPSGKMLEYLSLRRKLVETLNANYDSLISELARIDAEERSLRDSITRFREVLTREMFWRRSSPPADLRTFTDTPAAVAWFLSPENWIGGWKTLRTGLGRRPVTSTLVILASAALLAARSRLKRNLRATGSRTRRISTDRYRHTLIALGYTTLIALPWVLLLAYLSFILEREPANSDWTRGMSRGLKWIGVIVSSATLLMETSRSGGLGTDHFGWNETGTRRFRKMVRTILIAQTPLLLPLSSTLFEDNFRHFDSMGRLCINTALVISAIILWKFLHPDTGVFAPSIQRRPDTAFARTSRFWHPLIVLIPLALAALSSAGWVITAIALAFAFDATLATASVGILLYYMILRWFMIKERRLALEKALEERRARRDASRESDDQADETVTAEAERELDLDVVGEQTRRLLRSLTTVAVISFVWMIWAGSLPLEEVLGSAEIFHVSLLSIAQGALVIAIFSTFSRNLPGLLELSGLRAVVPDSGTRYAIATIGQYAIIATGLLLFSAILNIDWSKLGWIAAALSVGLGFGLQEVVANFVCGIILLFERPIRVGDVVTVDGIDGTVTRIQMRATTITNWDRKEFIVPNKQFITGTLMNWTLTNQINRVLIPVGVAYGTDTRRAREILLQVAAEHPRILENPAPAATFEQFGDSTLNLYLRCYLPNMDNRLTTINDLHTMIDERFKEAGIEIAFPQQDIHIRTINGKLPDA